MVWTRFATVVGCACSWASNESSRILSAVGVELTCASYSRSELAHSSDDPELDAELGSST